MTILGGVGTLVGPVIGAGVIKYLENIFSAINENVLHGIFDFLPEFLQDGVVGVVSLFVGDGWHLTLGALFVVIVVFLPGGIMEGVTRIHKRITDKKNGNKTLASTKVQPGE